MKKFLLPAACMLLLVVTSCGGGKKNLSAIDACLESVAAEFGKKAPDMETAMLNHNFDAARRFAGCYSDIPEEYAEKSFQVDNNEIEYLISEGNIDKAKATAKVLGSDFLYEKALAAEVNQLIQKEKFDAAINILSTWPFVVEFYPDGGKVYEEGEKIYGYPENNDGFNAEITSYNDLVDNVINGMLLNKKVNRKNGKTMVKVCNLYVDNAVQDENGNWTRQNTYKDLAIKKLQDVGVKVN